MVNKNTTKKTRKARKNFPLIKLICTISFLVGVILFVINAVTDYKTYTDSEIVKADVINVSGTKNGMLDVKYQYNYGGEKYEENVRQSVDEIKAGDKKEIRVKKNNPEVILEYNDINFVVLLDVVIGLCLELTVLCLYEMATNGLIFPL